MSLMVSKVFSWNYSIIHSTPLKISGKIAADIASGNVQLPNDSQLSSYSIQSLGNNYYCWITNPVALVIFFVVPVVLMLLFNIIALVRVLVAVRRVRKVGCWCLQLLFSLFTRTRELMKLSCKLSLVNSHATLVLV